jgi:hypothetical protein
MNVEHDLTGRSVRKNVSHVWKNANLQSKCHPQNKEIYVLTSVKNISNAFRMAL